MRSNWSLNPDIIYLNHGSFGPTPRMVQESQREWMQRLESNPQRFLSRELEGLLEETTQTLGEFLGCAGNDLIPVDNATYGMNLVARAVKLEAGDEVLLSTHEYGAVKRIWQQAALPVGAKMVQAVLPEFFYSAEQVVEQLFQQVTPSTRLLVISHVTSPTAIVFPVEEICRVARKQGITVCIDGPHAVAMRAINLAALDCDFYVASGHKWLSAPFGTGFLFVHPRWQQRMQPAIVSWGGSMSGRPRSWKDEFLWVGTRDLTGFLSIPAAIRFLQDYGLEKFREQTHQQAAAARNQLEMLFETRAMCADSSNWFGSMITVPLPETVPVPATWTGQPHPLQIILREKYRIEIPIIKWGHRMHVRVSCHLYNEPSEVDFLCESLKREIL